MVRAAVAAVAGGLVVAGAGDAAADIFCVGNGARPALVLRHVGETVDRETTAVVRRRLQPTRASCTTCHLAPGPESLLVPNVQPLWPFTAYGQALTILRPGLPPAPAADEAGTEDAFARVDRMPVDPRDPAGTTYGDRIRAGLPPQPLFPADGGEPGTGGQRPPREPATLAFKDALKLSLLRDGPILQASEVAEIDARTAGALARFAGTFLILGLRSLTADVAETLAASRAETVWLHSLTVIEPGAAAALAKVRGDLLLTGLDRLDSPELAAKLAARPGPLSLPFLRSVSVAAAAILVDRDDRVCLAALAEPPVEVQEALAAGRCRLDLPAVRRLESEALARKLAASPLVFLGGLAELPVNVAEMLVEPVAGRRGVVLPLAAVSPEAMAALLKAEPNALGRPIFVGRDLSAERLRTLAGLPADVAPAGAPFPLRQPKPCFPEITELSADLAAVAAECDAFFPNLRRLDSPALAAAVVRRDDGFLTLQAVQEITVEAAGEIANYKPREGLRLSSLRRLPADVARALLRTTRSFMDLGGLEEISAEALRVVLGRIRNDTGTSLLLGVSRLPPEPFAPTAEARPQNQRFDLNLPSLIALTREDAANIVAVMRPQTDILSINVPALSPDAANALADWGGRVQLSGLETLPPELARALARLPALRGYAGSINLDRVKVPEPASLVELTQAKRPFTFGGLDELTPELAKSLVKCPTCSLRFPGVTSVAPEVVAVLVTGTGQQLALPALTTVEPEVARLLAACPNWNPYLPAVKTLAPEAAGALASFVSRVGDLQSPGLVTLEPEVAEAVAKCQRWVPVFPAVKTLSPAAAAALAGCRRPIGLPGLTVLSPEAAAALAACPSWSGLLPGITGFDAADSVAVAAALARRPGKLSLPRLKRISPKTLGALLEKPDVEIPPIESLDLIAEPDGSPAEDVVIPEEFRRRQQSSREMRPRG